MELIKNKLAKNFISVSLGNIISQVLNFLVIIIIARKVNVNDFGKLSYAQNILLYVILFSTFGLTGYGNREIAKEHKKEIIFNIVFLRFALGVLSNVLLYIILLVLKLEKSYIQIIMLYSLSTIIMAFDLSWVFNGLMLMEHSALQSIIRGMIYFILIFFSELTIYKVSIIYDVSFLISVVYSLIIYHKKYSLELFIPNMEQMKKYIKESYYFLFQMIFSTINSNADIMIMGIFRNINEVGIYSAVYKIINIILMLVSFIISPLYPLLIKYYNEKKYDELSNIINKVYKLIYLIMVPIVFGGITLSKNIMNFVFGEKYIEGYIPFSILLIFTLILSIRETYAYCINAWYEHKKYTKIIFLSSSINLILNLIIIPIYGYKLAAISTLTSEFVNLYLFRRTYEGMKVTKKREHIYIIKVFCSAILMSIIVYVFSKFVAYVIVQILVGLIIYIVFIQIFKIYNVAVILKILTSYYKKTK